MHIYAFLPIFDVRTEKDRKKDLETKRNVLGKRHAANPLPNKIKSLWRNIHRVFKRKYSLYFARGGTLQGQPLVFMKELFGLQPIKEIQRIHLIKLCNGFFEWVRFCFKLLSYGSRLWCIFVFRL